MMRSFLTCLVRSVTRSLMLAPCLLICLACATPFPIKSLEKGMTEETVRETFGAPESTEDKPGGAESYWTYAQEEQNWFYTVLSSTVFLPHCIVSIAATMSFGAEYWCDAIIPTVEKGSIFLLFEEEKLVFWVVYEPVPVVSSGYAGDSWSQTQEQDSLLWQQEQVIRAKDITHHKKGHSHHHVVKGTSLKRHKKDSGH